MNGKKEGRFIHKEKPSISQNKKKAEFEKKIKKFIEADSPPESNPKPITKKATHNYSFCWLWLFFVNQRITCIYIISNKQIQSFERSS